MKQEVWTLREGLVLPEFDLEEVAEAEFELADPSTGEQHSFTGLQVLVMHAVNGERSPEEVTDHVSELLEVEFPVAEIRGLARLLHRLGWLEGFAPTSFGARLGELAARLGHAPAIITYGRDGCVSELSWSELDERSNRMAHYLAEQGVGPKTAVVVAVPNGPEHFITSFASWKVGAMVLPLRASLPGRELRELVALLDTPFVVGAEGRDVDGAVPASIVDELEGYSADPLPDVIACPGHAIASGGSTGRPKIVVDPTPWARVPEDSEVPDALGFASGQVQLVAGPLYHTTPFSTGYGGLFEAHTLVVMEKFDAANAVDLIERYQVEFLAVAPTVMQRIARLEDIEKRDLRSIRGIFHTGAPCPAWAKRAWIALIGGERVFESYGSTEELGGTLIRGDEWLLRPGSVGRPSPECEFAILDEEQKPLPANEIGEIYSRWADRRDSFAYIGASEPRATRDGFVSVGDLGWMDEDGYLYIADRRTDLILSGGANVYPAEVEAALSEHAGVFDVAVIGLPDDDWGKRVHAIVVRAAGNSVGDEELGAHCRQHIASYKCPKSYEFVDGLPRNDAGKLRRRTLIDERGGMR